MPVSHQRIILGEKREHPHFHYTYAQINIVNEMATLCQKGTLQLSAYNKNKVDVDSQRCQIRTFLLQEDLLQEDAQHDFPYRNSKLTPAGYQIPKPQLKRSRSISPPATNKLVRLRRCRLLASATMPKYVTTRYKMYGKKSNGVVLGL